MKTKEYYIKKHRELWSWLAENPDKEKASWPGWGPDKNIANDCFLCCYVCRLEDSSCENCPLDWTITKECMDTLPVSSYYILYEKTLSLEVKAKYAKIIANLPEKKEI